MIGVATVMLALSVGDLVAGGLTGEPQRFSRVLLGTFCGGVTSWVVLHATRLSPTPWWCALIGAVFGTLCWLVCKLKLAKAEGTAATRWAGGALSAMGMTLVLPVVFAAPLSSEIPRLTEWAHALPFPRAQAVTGGQVLLLLAILLFLSTPANSIVRALLTVAETDWKVSEQKVRGGRYIGVIERWMIFALALAGEPTAAALIVSAKSLLRFPELSKAAKGNQASSSDGKPVADIDAVTEYFLLGSLASWGLALVFVLLLF